MAADTPAFPAAPAVYRVAEVATLLRMGERQTREALIRGEIPGHKIGSQWRISAIALHRWLNGEEGGPHDVAIEETSKSNAGD